MLFDREAKTHKDASLYYVYIIYNMIYIYIYTVTILQFFTVYNGNTFISLVAHVIITEKELQVCMVLQYYNVGPAR